MERSSWRSRAVRLLPSGVQKRLARLLYDRPQPKELRTDRLFWGRDLYWKSDSLTPNFGDWVGPYLYREMTGREPEYRMPSNHDPETVVVSAGSLMGSVANNSVVWGTGIISRREVFYRPFQLRAVRGPVTRRRCLELGYDCPPVYGDPAVLLPRFFAPDVTVSYPLGVVPHYVDYEHYRRALGERDDILVVDVLRPVEDVVADILRCEALVSSSLHGVIVAHAYGRECGVLRALGKLAGDGVKYRDYLVSVGLRGIAPHPVDASELTVRALQRVPRHLPDPSHPTIAGDELFAECPWA